MTVESSFREAMPLCRYWYGFYCSIALTYLPRLSCYQPQAFCSVIAIVVYQLLQVIQRIQRIQRSQLASL
jgi:heme/copper-type cytochrome/quinol oxidase subunit 4